MIRPTESETNIAARGAIMPDPLSRAARHHELADECLKRSQLATDDKARAHYRNIAESYLVVAPAELAREEQERIRRQPQQ
jgi:hypothetical protein